jgi:hypothetical protein
LNFQEFKIDNMVTTVNWEYQFVWGKRPSVTGGMGMDLYGGDWGWGLGGDPYVRGYQPFLGIYRAYLGVSIVAKQLHMLSFYEIIG